MPLFALPPPPTLSPAGHALIVEYEVGGEKAYRPHPEAPDARYSGVTEGIGYDNSTNAPTVIVVDWRSLGQTNARRLAATHPFTGRAAQTHLHEVADILVPWENALGVFDSIDVTRTYQQCRRTFPGFEDLRPNAKAALVSLVFNRGDALNGPSRTEMRAITVLSPRKDYAAMAGQLRIMKRVWRGTSIERGMNNRREAEARLMETP